MKPRSILILFYFVMLYMSVFGQDKKNFLTLSGSLTHLKGKVDPMDQSDHYLGYYEFPFGVGVELMYSTEVASRSFCEIGMLYQKLWVSSSVETQRRFFTDEIGIPLCVRRNFTLHKGNQHYLTAGIVLGKIIKIIGENLDSPGWRISNTKYYEGFSKDTFYNDMYFGWGYVFTGNNKSNVYLSPYLKYRFNSTWVNHYESRLSYGIKVGIIFEI